MSLRKEKPDSEKTITELLHSSKSNEWYTPIGIIDPIREVLGRIDLDPASCDEANEIIRAERYYTIKDDGLSQPWYGKVFMNPPYGYFNGLRGVSNAGAWTQHLIDLHEKGDVEEAIVLVNANVGDTWWMNIIKTYPFLLVNRRIRYQAPKDGTKKSRPGKGNSLIYIGENKDRFREILEDKYNIGLYFNRS